METRQTTRTQKALKNAGITSAMQIASIILNFVSRTVFIYLLNADYLGVNSLFTNILTILSFTELGIGTAIVYQLYKPIANKNKHKIQALMHFYKKTYMYIGTTIFLLGLSLIPFMDFIIKDPPKISENLVLIYLMFLFNSAISYFFSYKKSIITASQKEYIVQIYTRIFQIIQIILQTIFLIITHSYIIYLVIMIICTITTNFLLCLRANKLYPFLKHNNKKNKLSKKEQKTIFGDVKALFLYKFSEIILSGTDNIIISTLHGITSVGISSNYTLITQGARSIIDLALNSVMAGIGNLSVKGSRQQINNVINQLLLICVWIYGLLGIGFMCLANDFIIIWIGSDYLLDNYTVFAIIFSTYVMGVQFPAYSFRTAQGMFVQKKWTPVITTVLNIILSIFLGIYFGVAGVFIATGISRLLTTTIVDPWLVYKNNFNKKPFIYYVKYSLYFLAVLFNGICQYFILSNIQLNGLLGFFVKVLILLVTTNIIFLIEFGWTKDFKNLINRFKHNKL